MSDDLANIFIQSLERMVQDIRGQRLIFFVAGRAGWGKSSTINSLIGQKLCEVNDNEPQTQDVTGFDFEMKGIKCTIFDTPGFCDGRGNDDAYIDKIRDKVRQPDSMWYVSRLDETRPEDDERVIKIISKALGNRPWENAVIIFTFANNVKPEKYSEKLRKRTELIHKAIAQYMPEHEKNVAYEIPVCAIDNESPKTPDGKEWLGALFTAVAQRVSAKGTLALLYMLGESINQRTLLSKTQKELIRKKFVSTVFNTMTSAMGVGVVIAGIIGSPVIIGFSGGGILGTLIGAWLSKSDADDDY